MKTFKQLMTEVAQPRSADERNFKDKHDVEFIDHPESEESQHTSSRRKTSRRADYMPGEDEDVYEAVSPKHGVEKMPEKLVYDLGELSDSVVGFELPRLGGIKLSFNTKVSTKILADKLKTAISSVKFEGPVRGSNRKEYVYYINAINEAIKNEPVTVDKEKYSWGTLIKISKGRSHSFPVHPDEQDKIKKIKDGGKITYRDETGTKITVSRSGDTILFDYPGSNDVAEVDRKVFTESKLDPVNKKAVSKDFDNRKDKDIDNDGDVDDSDEYLHKRRKAISKAMKKENIRWLDEKASSKAQQKLMGMALAYKKGDLEDASDEVKELADSMSKKDLEDYAKTKHKGLPDKVDESTSDFITKAAVAKNKDKKKFELGGDKYPVTIKDKNAKKVTESLNEAFKKGSLELDDGSTVDLSKQDADLLNQMFDDLNPTNKKKMKKAAMEDEVGFEEILGFAREAL